ncbi:MAG: SUMF1/EgtB/PvdO family nonheme iron enzyme [Myxococcales bacterium]|nr:SUMF1/EgtB/PvdO family nonheme iron enzyme [Myxococcales bacterium]
MRAILLGALLLGACAEASDPPSEPAPIAPAPEPEPPSAPEPAPETVPAAVSEPRSPCPPEMALVGGRFCIDRWEATTVAEDGKPHSPYHAVTYEKVSAESRPGVVPQAHISMEQADLACKRSGKRLCTTQQWVDACMGTDKPKRRFPYGPKEESTACNTNQGGAHPLMVLHQGRRPTDSFQMNDPRINQVASTVAPTAAFETCVTPEGVHDLVGNLLEWTRGERPLLMGGYYLDAKENGTGCTYVTERHGEKYHDFTTGFRCCFEPEPAALKGAETVAASVQVPVPSEARDPAGLRSFADPGAKLPPKPAPPAYEPADAACPVDMALVDGERCLVPEQQCLRWLEVPGQEPQRACAEFKAPTRCTGGRQSMRYCIDRYEYTPAGWSLPLVNVSWGEAQNICGAMDKRLCREEEWELACEGPDALPYPYGHVRDGSACNHDLDDLFDPRRKLRDRRLPADSLPRCKSPFGVFNLVGNVDEWTTRESRDPPWRSILRGGWWLTGRNRCRAATESHSEIYAGSQTSFRCCKAARK